MAQAVDSLPFRLQATGGERESRRWLRARRAQLDHVADARAAIERALELLPNLSIEFIQSVFASQSDDFRARVAHGLRLAGARGS